MLPSCDLNSIFPITFFVHDLSLFFLKTAFVLQKFEEFSNFLVLFSLFDEICHRNLVRLRENLSNEFFDLLVYYLIRYAEDFEACTDRTVYKKLQFDKL